MSIKIMSAVWERFHAGGSELLALLALADWSDDDGRCFPSVASIAKKTRLSKSQAQRVVHGLIDSGVVRVEGNESGGAPGATRRYRIVVDRLTGSASATGRTDATGSADDTPTDRAHATGSASATGRVDAADGSHGCGDTGRMGATQTVIEPSGTTKRGEQAAPPSKRARKKREEVTLTAYIEACKTSKVKPLPDDHGIRVWADEAGITAEMLQIAWVQFHEQYTEKEMFKNKRYKDWPGHFANAVKGNWLRLWFYGDHGMQWSSTGMTHKAVMDARMAQKEAEHA